MQVTLTKSILVLFAISALTTVQAQQSRSVLGKIDHQALLDAAPGLPATPAEAGKRAFGANITAQTDPVALEGFYAPFNQRLASARAVIAPAVANSQRNMEAIGQRTRAQAESSPIISRMGGTEKIAQMSEEETQRAAIQAAGDYQQSLSGAPPGSGGGMQAMMKKMMNDPAYQERFEKMSKIEQEAEIQKYMGKAPPPPTGPTAAEKRAQVATSEASAALAKTNALSAIMQRLNDVDASNPESEKKILAAPGSHADIAKDINARIEKLPSVTRGELTEPDPTKYQALQRERVSRDRARAAWELQQSASLLAKRRTKYKEIAASYSTWLKQNAASATTQTAQMLDDSSVEMAVQFENRLLELSESLAKYSADSTRNAAQYEWSYQKEMSEPLAR